MSLRFTSSFVVFACAVALMSSACSRGDFQNSGGSETKNATVPAANGVANSLGPAKGIPIARAVYELKVKGNTGLELCTGVATFILSDNFNMKPTGNLQCLLGGNQSLANLFGGGDDLVLENADLSHFAQFGKIVRKQNPVSLVPGAAIFKPQRPSFIGPIIQNEAVFDRLTLRESSEVQGITKEGQSFQTSGEWFLQVHEIGLTFVPEGYSGPMTFPSTIRWELKAVGFNGMPRAQFMAFDSITYWYSTRAQTGDPKNSGPQIAVPKIEIKAQLRDIAGSLGPQSATIQQMGDLLFGGATITLTVREHTPL